MHARPELVDHLLVELADPPAGGARLARHEDAEEAAVGNRPAGGDRHDPGIAPALERVGDPIPDEARLELRELVGGIRAGEHREDALERLARQRLEGRRVRHGRQQVVDRPAVHDGHGDDLLGQHVERIAGDRGRLDRALAHPLGHDRALQQVAAVLGEDDPAAHLVDLVTSPADALEPAGHGGRRLDLDHEVDGSHVDPQLERRGRHERGQAAVLERLLDRDALLAGDGAVVGPDQLLPGQLVEALGQPLREAPAVDEHERAAVGPDQLEDPRMDGRPDADALLATADSGRPAGPPAATPRPADACPRPARRPGGRAPCVVPGSTSVTARPFAGTGQEPPDSLQRSLGGRQPDPLERRRARCAKPLETLKAQGEVRAALRARDGVDLVDDHVLDATQDLARL